VICPIPNTYPPRQPLVSSKSAVEALNSGFQAVTMKSSIELVSKIPNGEPGARRLGRAGDPLFVSSIKQ